jgi:acetylornithine/succinyldiaminopimelate/putrescine aminotransferase
MISERQLFLQYVAQTSDTPLCLEIERAEGVYLFDKSGKKYIDLISGISVSALGHCHPKVVEGVKEQLEHYMHLMVYGEYVLSPQVKLAKRLCELLPKSLNNVYFVNSGAEAVEGAMKLAKRFSNRAEIISFKNAYHGSTQGALSIIGNEDMKRPFRPLLPDTKSLRYNHVEDLNEITTHTAGVICEVVQGEAGVIPVEEIFLTALRKRCSETGTLLIFDEVQTGYGRTGKLFAFEHYRIIPDILLLAKSFGGGLPLGAFISSEKIMSAFKTNPALGHITTFGGNPVCCAAGLATLNAIIEENLTNQVAAKERMFRKLLVHPNIKNFRSKGLLIALELDSWETNKKVIDYCIEHGVVTDWFLFAPNCMRIAPPLVITEKDIRLCCDVILQGLDK